MGETAWYNNNIIIDMIHIIVWLTSSAGLLTVMLRIDIPNSFAVVIMTDRHNHNYYAYDSEDRPCSTGKASGTIIIISRTAQKVM